MGTMASQITSLTIVYWTVYLGADQRKHQSSASLAFVRGIHRWPVNSPHKGPVTRKMFPFDDVIMEQIDHFGDSTGTSHFIDVRTWNDGYDKVLRPYQSPSHSYLDWLHVMTRVLSTDSAHLNTVRIFKSSFWWIFPRIINGTDALF